MTGLKVWQKLPKKDVEKCQFCLHFTTGGCTQGYTREICKIRNMGQCQDAGEAIGKPVTQKIKEAAEAIDNAWRSHWSCEECYYKLSAITCNGCEDGSNFISAKEQDRSKSKRGQALVKALEIINGERQDDYGSPEDSFATIGKYWSVYLHSKGKLLVDDIEISPREVAEMMTLFKVARMSGQKITTDNYDDAAGYIGIAGDMAAEEVQDERD